MNVFLKLMNWQIKLLTILMNKRLIFTVLIFGRCLVRKSRRVLTSPYCLDPYNKYKGHREQNVRKLFYADFTINLSFSKIIHKIRQSIA